MLWRRWLKGVIGCGALGEPKAQQWPPAGQAQFAINVGAAGAYCTFGLVHLPGQFLQTLNSDVLFVFAMNPNLVLLRHLHSPLLDNRIKKVHVKYPPVTSRSCWPAWFHSLT